MSNWFALGSWDLAAHSEVTWKHFEDIRRAIYLLRSCLIYASEYPETDTWAANHTYTLFGVTYNGYRCSDVVYHVGMWWTCAADGETREPTKAAWNGWYPQADSTKYYHYCKNSLYWLGNMQCSHTVEDYEVGYVCEAWKSLPTQTWHLTNCTHFTEWATATNYKVGDKRKVSDTTIARDGMVCGYICIQDHTSGDGTGGTVAKPTTTFPTPIVSDYWRSYGDPVEVSSASFISEHSGSRYADLRGGDANTTKMTWPYGVIGGWPESESTMHGDIGFAEYQAAVERVLDGMGWMFTPNDDYYWADQGTNPKPSMARGDDWRWQSNKSCFEYILKRIGSYSWYWDSSYPPSNLNSSHVDQPCEFCAANGHTDATTKTHAVWRRGWRYAMNTHDHVRLQATITTPHAGGTQPPSAPTGTHPNYETAQLLLDHTQNLWHGNPCVGILNDMKSALDEALYLNWAASISWKRKLAEWPNPGPYDAGPFASLIAAQEDSDAQARALMAANGWYSDTKGWPLHRAAGSCSYYDDHWDYYSTGLGCAAISSVKLIITIATPPRHAAVSGGIKIRSWGMAYVDYTAWDPPTEWVHFTDLYWTSSVGNIKAFSTGELTEFEDTEITPAIGATTEIIFLPPDGVPEATPIPPANPDINTGYASGGHTEGNWSAVASEFYIKIDRDISIL